MKIIRISTQTNLLKLDGIRIRYPYPVSVSGIRIRYPYPVSATRVFYHAGTNSRFTQQCNVMFCIYADLCSLLAATSQFSFLIGQDMQWVC